MTESRVKLRPEISALRAYSQGRPAAPGSFKLSSNENPFPPLPAVLEAIATSSFNRYPDAAATWLRAQLADRYGVRLEEVHVGSGSVAILQQLILAAAGPSDEVVYAWRSFEAYPGLVTVSGATSVTVPLRSDATHDLDAMAEAVTERTRVAIVCSPNNPTSAILTETAFKDFMTRVPESVLVLLDEAYAEFVTDPIAVNGTRLLSRYPNLVVLRTFSKAYGLAGLRLGYAIGSSYILDAARSTAIPLSVTEPAQRAALAALENESEILEQVLVLIARREELERALLRQGWRIPPAQGNFVWLPTGMQTGATAEILEAHGVIARAFPPDGIRVSIGEMESIAPLLSATAEALQLVQGES